MMKNINKKEKVSVIITNINNEKTIERCLDSVLNQSYKNIEIVIVDNGNNELYTEICKKYMNKNDVIHCYSLDNSLSSNIYNESLKHANGDYVLFVDGNDFLDKDAISYLNDLINKNGSDIAITNINEYYDEKDTIDNDEEINIIDDDNKYNLFWEDNKLAVLPYGKLYKKEVLDNIRYPEDLKQEDEYVAHQILSNANKIVISNKELYNYNINNRVELNNSNTMENKYHECIALLNRMRFFQDSDLKGYADKTKEDLNNYIDSINSIKDALPDEAYYLNEINYIKKIMNKEEDNNKNKGLSVNKMNKNYEPKISVIVPIYNQQKYLRKCLDSIKNQTLNEIEILCVDDGSNDLSYSIMSEYNYKDERFRIFHQVNSGVSAARNFAMKEAKGKYIAFMDPDDWYFDNEALESLYNAAEENNILVCGGCFTESNEVTGERLSWNGILSKYTFDENKLYDYKDYQCDFGFHRFIYNRDFIISNNLFMPEIKRYEDVPWFVSVMAKAKKFYAINKNIYGYRSGHKNPQTSKEGLLAILEGMNQVIQIAKENNYNELIEYQLIRIQNTIHERLKPFILDNDKEISDALNKITNTLNDGRDVKNLLYNSLIIKKDEKLNELNQNNIKQKETIDGLNKNINSFKTEIQNIKKENEDLKSSIKTIDDKSAIISKQIDESNKDKAIILENNKKEIDRLIQERDNLNIEMNVIKAELDRTFNSYNWRVGKAILYIPKKIYYLLKKLFGK